MLVLRTACALGAMHAVMEVTSQDCWWHSGGAGCEGGPGLSTVAKRLLRCAAAILAIYRFSLLSSQTASVLLTDAQGASVAAYASAGPGLTADICSPSNRGTLFGVCSVAALLGPVIGPPLGGGLSQVSSPRAK